MIEWTHKTRWGVQAVSSCYRNSNSKRTFGNVQSTMDCSWEMPGSCLKNWNHLKSRLMLFDSVYHCWDRCMSGFVGRQTAGKPSERKASTCDQQQDDGIARHQYGSILPRYCGVQEMPQKTLYIFRCQLPFLCWGVLAFVLCAVHPQIYRWWVH